MNFSRISARVAGRIGLVSAITGMVIALSPMTFAAPINGTVQDSQHHQSNGGSKFQLINLSVSPVQGSSRKFDLTVTVAQNSADGSSDTKNFHAFPSTIYIQLMKDGNVVNSTPYSATLITPGNPGITFKPGTHGSVSGAAEYQFSLPSGVSGSQNENLRIFSPPAENSSSSNARYTFRMGISNDPSWSDDVVAGTSDALGNLPYGQLPEVPYAAALPLAGAGAAVLIWRFRKTTGKRAATSIGKIG